MCKRMCEICGTEFDDKGKFKPRKYCSDNCGNYNKFRDALEKCLLNLEPTKKATTLIRGDMFRFANLLSKRTNSNKE